eukprot:COSAG02_NODE_307_length_25111_cov_5.306693_18_plen_104_part_00
MVVAFQDTVRVSCKPTALAFSLSIRVPTWAKNATIDGEAVQAGTFAQKTCIPGAANEFTLELAPEIVVEAWAADKHGGAAKNAACDFTCRNFRCKRLVSMTSN